MPDCDACGWMAALGGMLAFGSFGVPIKSKVARNLDIDPLVFQTYKTTMCFLTSWLVLLYGEEFTFTPWGIVSGLFWVPGGIATIYAVKNAGLAIGIGVGSSFIVLVSFTWGIFVFQEHVHSRYGACFAVGCMMIGLLGMAYYSAPASSANYSEVDAEDSEGSDYSALRTSSADEDDFVDETPAGDVEEAECEDQGIVVLEEVIPSTHVFCCGMKWQRRTLGIMSAAFCGIYGGSIMVPMKWAPTDDKGLGYLISFAIGASIVNLSLWVFRYLYLCQRHRSFSTAYQALPSFHIRKMWLYGGTCGLLWSIGNMFSIISVEFLGEGVGYSVVQSSMLVSGLWGIFYFNEIQGATTIFKWLLSATVTVLGILLLSYEHHEK